MEVYQIEQQKVEQNSVWRDIRGFVEGEALSLPLHEAEEGLFRRLLALGRELLKEVLARHGTGKTQSEVVLSSGERLPYHILKDRKYLSIFGLVKIGRAYYWKGCRWCRLNDRSKPNRRPVRRGRSGAVKAKRRKACDATRS